MDAYLGWIYLRMASEGYAVKNYPRFSAMMGRHKLRPSVQRVVEREAEEEAQMKREGLSWETESFLSGSEK